MSVKTRVKSIRNKAVLSIIATTLVLSASFIPGIVHAEILGYSDHDAVDCSSTYGIYSWCKGGVWYSGRGYAYRNCTDYVAWKLQSLGVPDSATRGLGNGGQWYDNAPAGKKSLVPKAGSAAVQQSTGQGDFGHVAFIESVNSNGTITISEYNFSGNGTGGTRTGTPGSLGFTRFVDFGLNPPVANPGGPQTIGIYDPTAAVFHERNSNTPGPADMQVPYGNSNWIPLAGDWNNDKVFTPGTYDPNTGTFYLSNSNVPGGPPDTPSFAYGNIGWIPIAGDWDGNGYWSIGMYDPSTATFYLRNTNSAGAADYTFQFGNSGWKPITGDWDGHDDGNPATTIGVYNPSTATYYLNNQNDNSAAESTIQYGNLGWVPISGDWDGNGFASIGAYNPSISTFYLRNSNAPGPADVTVQYGNAGWKPVIGDWDAQ